MKTRISRVSQLESEYLILQILAVAHGHGHITLCVLKKKDWGETVPPCCKDYMSSFASGAQKSAWPRSSSITYRLLVLISLVPQLFQKTGHKFPGMFSVHYFVVLDHRAFALTL